MTRLAYLISQYPAYNHTFILREVRQLRALGWDIQTISIGPCDRPPERLTEEEADEYGRTLFIKTAGVGRIAAAHLRTLVRRPVAYLSTMLYALRMGHGGLRALLYFAEAVVAGAWMRERGLTHLHTHFSSTVALLLQKIFPVSSSMTIHGPAEFVDPVGFCLQEKIEASRFVVAISKYGRSQLMQNCSWEHWSKLEVCRLGVDPAVFTPQPPREQGAGPLRLICVARLAPVKGQHILVGAVHGLKKIGVNVRLSLVGGGPDRESLERRVVELGLRDSVIFEGWCNQDRVRELYRESDLFVLASFAEGIPVVLMEAMAMQIPCIGTTITGIPELISNGVNGILVAPSDEEELMAAIARAADSPEWTASLGAAARLQVLEHFNLETNVTELSAVFERYLGSGVHGAAAKTISESVAC